MVAGVIVCVVVAGGVAARGEPWVVVVLPDQVEVAGEKAKSGASRVGLVVSSEGRRPKVGEQGGGARVMKVDVSEARGDMSLPLARWLGADSEGLYLIELPANAEGLKVDGEVARVVKLDRAAVARGQQVLGEVAGQVRAAMKSAGDGVDGLKSASWKSQRQVLAQRADDAWRLAVLEGTGLEGTGLQESDGDRAAVILKAWWCELVGAAAGASRKVAEEAARSLLAVAVIPPGEEWMGASSAEPTVIPMWRSTGGGLQQLAGLSQFEKLGASGERWSSSRQSELVIRLEAMNAAAKMHHLWIIDEAGWIDGRTRASRGVMGVMTPIASMRSSLRMGGEVSVLEPLRVEAANFVARRPADGTEGAATVRLEPVIDGPTFVAGDAVTGLMVASRPVALTPPGLVVDRWAGEWTQGSFMGETASRAAAPRATMLVQVVRDAGSVDAEAGVMVYFELAAGVRQARLHVGPFGQKRSITIWIPEGSGDGKVTRSGGLGENAARVRTVRREGASAVMIELGAELIEGDGVLRLGADVTASDGTRFSWPRAMLPWQETPGRLAIQTRGWDVFDAAR
jgi:hypothetical protein